MVGALHRSAVSLGFYGDELDPAELTEGLGGKPTIAVRKGGIWLTSRGAEKIARTGSWRIEVERSTPADIDGQIRTILEPLTEDFGVWRDFAARYRGRFFCGLFLATGNEGLTLQPDTLAAIGARGLVLDLDIYGAVPEDFSVPA